jgi:hypothetical protein
MPIPVQTADEDAADEAAINARVTGLEADMAALRVDNAEARNLLRQLAQAILDTIPGS